MIDCREPLNPIPSEDVIVIVGIGAWTKLTGICLGLIFVGMVAGFGLCALLARQAETLFPEVMR